MMIVKETVKTKNNKPCVYYRCKKCDVRSKASEVDANSNFEELFSEAFERFSRELHREATIRGIRAAKLKKAQKNGL